MNLIIAGIAVIVVLGGGIWIATQDEEQAPTSSQDGPVEDIICGYHPDDPACAEASQREAARAHNQWSFPTSSQLFPSAPAKFFPNGIETIVVTVDQPRPGAGTTDEAPGYPESAGYVFAPHSVSVRSSSGQRLFEGETLLPIWVPDDLQDGVWTAGSIDGIPSSGATGLSSSQYCFVTETNLAAGDYTYTGSSGTIEMFFNMVVERGIVIDSVVALRVSGEAGLELLPGVSLEEFDSVRCPETTSVETTWLSRH